MSNYSQLSEALQDLNPSQVKIHLDTSGDEHSVTLKFCGEGLSYIFEQITEYVPNAKDKLTEICPQLVDINTADLVVALLSGDDPDDIIETLLDGVSESSKSSVNSTSKTVILDNPQIGDVITSTREVTNITHGYNGGKMVNFKDQSGKRDYVLATSWKGYGANRKVSRK